MTAVFEWAKTVHALDRAATVIFDAFFMFWCKGINLEVGGRHMTDLGVMFF
jgi:hypothetical protein